MTDKGLYEANKGLFAPHKVKKMSKKANKMAIYPSQTRK
jgi:hypothetical protein